MSQSPFQNVSPATDPNAADPQLQTPPVRRLQSPAERFGAEQVARDSGADAEVSPFDSSYDDGDDGSSQGDAELKPPREGARAVAPDPFQRLPRASEARAGRSGRIGRGERGAETRRARRRIKPHAPHYHRKKPHAVAHKPIKSAPENAPQNEWDKAAQNSMARAALARKRGRVRRIVGRVIIASGVLLMTWSGAMALTAPQFAVKDVAVSGLKTTSPQQVSALTSRLIGQNIFRAPRAQVAREVEAIPTVASARVERAWTWPPHIKVEVTERQPILQIGAGTTWWVADAQGVAFRRANRDDSALDKLAAPQLQPVTGKALPAAPWKRARELEMAIAADNALAARENAGSSRAESKQNKFWDLRRVYLDKDGAASLRVSGQGTLKSHGELLIRLGEESWPAKLKQARMALAFFERTGNQASELDLVSSDHPRWRPKTEPTPTAQRPIAQPANETSQTPTA